MEKKEIKLGQSINMEMKKDEKKNNQTNENSNKLDLENDKKNKKEELKKKQAKKEKKKKVLYQIFIFIMDIYLHTCIMCIHIILLNAWIYYINHCIKCM